MAFYKTWPDHTSSFPRNPPMASLCAKKKIQSSWHALGGVCDLSPPPSSFLLLPDYTTVVLCSRFPFRCVTYSLICFRSWLRQHLHREVSLRTLFQPCFHLHFHSLPLCSGASVFAEHWIHGKQGLFIIYTPLPWLLLSQLQVLLGQGLFFILSSAPKRYRPSLHKFLLTKRMNKWMFFLQSRSAMS